MSTREKDPLIDDGLSVSGGGLEGSNGLQRDVGGLVGFISVFFISRGGEVEG